MTERSTIKSNHKSWRKASVTHHLDPGHWSDSPEHELFVDFSWRRQVAFSVNVVLIFFEINPCVRWASININFQNNLNILKEMPVQLGKYNFWPNLILPGPLKRQYVTHTIRPLVFSRESDTLPRVTTSRYLNPTLWGTGQDLTRFIVLWNGKLHETLTSSVSRGIQQGTR
jgi:hypothetical protein